MAQRRMPRLPLPDTGCDPAHTERDSGGRQPMNPSVAACTTSLWRAEAPRQTDVLARVSQLLLIAGSPHGTHPVRRNRR